VDEGNFLEVVMNSPDVVVLDCCASWCGPCKELTPKLAAAVQHCEGVRLAIMDIDQCPDIASKMQIDSVPMVFAIFQGKVVDKMVGMQTNEAISEFFARLAKLTKGAGAQELLTEGGAALSEGRVEEALQAYGEVLKIDKENYGAFALAGMALCALALKDLPGASHLVSIIQKDFKQHLEEAIVKQALTAVEVASAAQDVDADQLQALRAAVEADGNDHAARHQLAVALFGLHEYTEAMDHCMEIVKRDKAWEDDGGRKLLFKFFDTLGASHPEVQAARRRLSILLF